MEGSAVWDHPLRGEAQGQVQQHGPVRRGEHVMTVGATVPEMHVDIWSGSHPFYTGKAAFVDAAGRVEKFQNKFKGDYFKNKKK